MANKNEKPINYGNLSRFYQNLKNNDLSGIATEQYVDDAIAEIPQLEAGENVEIADNKINAKGYFYNDEKKEELKSIDDIIQSSIGQPLGLKISGAADATTYTYTDDLGGAFAEAIQYGMLPGVGSTYQTANGKSGVIAAVDTTTITFEETLDATNALTNEPVVYIVNTTQLFSFAEGIYNYTECPIPATSVLTLSGAAGATTYTFGGNYSLFYIGEILHLQDGRSAKIVSYDTSNNTITFEETFDADNALTNEQVISFSVKNIASGKYSHVEGGGYFIDGTTILPNTASGIGSHAEGTETNASGDYSHAEGQHTIAQNQSEHAEGQSNVSHKVSDTYGNSGNTQHSIGIGNTSNQKNAFEIMQNGDMYVLGVGGYQGTNTKVQDATIKTLQEYIASLEARIAALENPNA